MAPHRGLRRLSVCSTISPFLRSLPFCLTLLVVSSTQHQPDNTLTKELSREPDERPLIFTTLGGGMVALEQTSGNILWTLKDEPAVKVPNENDNVPQFLPDPRYGSLYMLGTHGGERQILKKLPFTIPQLVANAPCRSSDGILYTGKKIDTWFMIDPKTGVRKQVLGYEKSQLFDSSQTNTCPIDPKSAIFVARTEYNVLMYDSKNENQRWNITFFDYSSHNMAKEMSNSYGIVHFTSTSNGKITSFDRKTGQIMWNLDMQSPVVAAYILDRDGLISVPFNTVGDDTMKHIMEDVSSLQNGQGFKHSNIELFPSLYVGEHNHGLYALSSLVDKNTITISSDGPQPLLLEGPVENGKDTEMKNVNNKNGIPNYKQNINVHFNVKRNEQNELSSGYLLLGHYSVPEDVNTNFKMLTSKSTSLSLPLTFVKTDSISNSQLRLIVGPNSESAEQNWYEIENTTEVDLKLSTRESHDRSFHQSDDNDRSINTSMNSVSSQTDDGNGREEILWKFVLRNTFIWITQQEHIGIKFLLIVVVGLLILVFWYLRNQILIFQQLSQSGSRFSNSSYIYNGKMIAVPEELEDGSTKVGKIIFHPEKIIGKGCEGTFVYRGTFENRDVAVKRLLPGCFSFADREVALLSESDAHANVVRYYCMEQDRSFRYIALELCAATLQEYVLNNLESEYNIGCLEVLRQATSGLMHLHTLDIVHRDIKPHNVLLSVPSNKSPVRAMISDFGLCKKLNIGRHSFSRRSGVTGTDGWIAPEMIKGERTTTSVDIFSLGCVFHYVLSKGVHPFGTVLERQTNILGGAYNFDELSLKLPSEEVDLAACLIKNMLNSNSQCRPSASVVYNFPLFWTKQQVLSFFQDVSDRVERDPPGGPLEDGGLAVVRGDWRGRVGTSVAADLRRYRSYSGDSVRDLLRALRNKKHHYRELSLEAQESLGSIPEEFTMYWLKRFPRLLLHTWLQMQVFKDENLMKSYYDSNYEFDRKYITNEIENNDLKKYDEDFVTEGNNLFIKSKHYVYFSQGKKEEKSPKFKKDMGKYRKNTIAERQNKNPKDNAENQLPDVNLESHNNDEVILQSRFSPSKNTQQGEKNTHKGVKKNYSNEDNSTFSGNVLDTSPSTLSTIPENKIKVRNRKKKEEVNTTWIPADQ
ncbi:serine/threonine-protein kinase/endoribonuclease IRE1-like [Arctopsyche grandis]|uniref:serine/threonine-protein kinase/endoribonuclease IRE1-like n=1 Tax=Arctopsyche grandis TaxID=121162 RepID=UPI00406D72B3